MHARMVHSAHHRNGLAAEFHNFDGNLRLQDFSGEPPHEFGLELFDGQTQGMNPADPWQVEVSTWTDPHRLIGDLFYPQRPDLDLIVRSKRVVRRVLRLRQMLRLWNPLS